MKTAGNVLSVLFDEQFMNKANECSKLFDSWQEITAKNGIAAAAAHSRIKDLDRGILLVEMDHPGWKQILQTKQAGLLNDFRRRFPDMGISGISLMLGKGTEKQAQEESASGGPVAEEPQKDTLPSAIEEAEPAAGPKAKGFDAINDEGFKETLKSLGQSIKAREKNVRLH